MSEFLFSSIIFHVSAHSQALFFIFVAVRREPSLKYASVQLYPLVQISTLTIFFTCSPPFFSTTPFFTCFSFPSPRCCSVFGPVRGELQREAGAGWRGRMCPLCSPGMCVFVTNRKKREREESEADQILLQVFHKQHNSANRFPSPLSLSLSPLH